MRASRFSPLLSLVLVAACAGSAGPDASPSPPPPSPSPSGSPVADFTIEVFPAEEPTASRLAIPGSPYCLLVVVTEAGTGAGDPVRIEASATGASIAKIVPADLAPGVVGEVWVVADPTSVETTATVTITATRGETVQSITRALGVFPMADERAADAKPHFDRWVAWLASARPELGITADTQWEPVFASTLLVVSHYAYWSEDWELTIAWHNMIPPDDWSDAFLRRRGEETTYGLAFRQDSVANDTEPHEITPPEEVVR